MFTPNINTNDKTTGNAVKITITNPEKAWDNFLGPIHGYNNCVDCIYHNKTNSVLTFIFANNESGFMEKFHTEQIQKIINTSNPGSTISIEYGTMTGDNFGNRDNPGNVDLDEYAEKERKALTAMVNMRNRIPSLISLNNNADWDDIERANMTPDEYKAIKDYEKIDEERWAQTTDNDLPWRFRCDIYGYDTDWIPWLKTSISD